MQGFFLLSMFALLSSYPRTDMSQKLVIGRNVGCVCAFIINMLLFVRFKSAAFSNVLANT